MKEGGNKKMISAASTEQSAVMVRGASDVALTVPQQAILGTILGSEQLVAGGLPRTRKKVAIVGFAPSSMEDVKFVWDDPDMEIWGINQLYMAFPKMAEKATRWFQIHHRHSYDACVTRDHSHHEWLAKQTKFPIYMQRKEPDIPMSIKFPVIEILQKFRRYFTNSISWEIAVAILEGFKEVHLYGIDMAQDSEYAFERPSVEYFLGYLEGTGAKLVLPDKCDLCKSMWLYPFEDDAPFRAKVEARRQELRGRLNQSIQQESQGHDIRLQVLGALDDLNYIEKTWGAAAKNLEGVGFYEPPKQGE